MENLPKWLLSKNKTIYYHEDPFSKSNDWGLMLKDVLFCTNTTNTGFARILWDVKLSSAWTTNEKAEAVKKLKLDDFRIIKGGSIAVRRNPLLKQDGFHLYAIFGKQACENPLEYETPSFNGENIIEYLLEDTGRSG